MSSTVTTNSDKLERRLVDVWPDCKSQFESASLERLQKTWLSGPFNPEETEGVSENRLPSGPNTRMFNVIVALRKRGKEDLYAEFDEDASAGDSLLIFKALSQAGGAEEMWTRAYQIGLPGGTVRNALLHLDRASGAAIGPDGRPFSLMGFHMITAPSESKPWPESHETLIQALSKQEGFPYQSEWTAVGYMALEQG